MPKQAPTKLDHHTPDDIGLDMEALRQQQDGKLATLARAYVQCREQGGVFPELHQSYNDLKAALMGVRGNE